MDAPLLAELIRQLQQNSDQARALWEAHTLGALTSRPGRAKWSAVDCLEHLNISNRAFLPRIDQALAELRSRDMHHPGPFRMSWNARLLVYWLEPPSRLRLPTTKPFFPDPGLEPNSVAADFEATLERLTAQLRSADGLALDRIQVRSPFAERMKYNLYSALVVIPAHNRRHLWQAERAAQGV
jgi:hypothetical protein